MPINFDKLSTQDKNAYLDKIRHSAAHVLAESVKKIYPSAKLTIGPSIEDGFYYDFDVAEPFTPNDLISIEKEKCIGKIVSITGNISAGLNIQ